MLKRGLPRKHSLVDEKFHSVVFVGKLDTQPAFFIEQTKFKSQYLGMEILSKEIGRHC